ncbi:MAG: sigma 54-interacting transcriptional regulator [Deltaproteobacteria bacterium]|nr:sigma 54-interacting transcriptional regulator [Deltaproteobacteria bacterium]
MMKPISAKPSPLCPALPSALLASEPCGYAKGAFTGAARNQPGRIALCQDAAS